jgi:MATE family multidrug resistance protein
VPYIWTLAPCSILSLSYLALRNTLAALSFARAPLIVAVFMVGMNGLLAYTLIFGHFGFPRLELVGAGIATATSSLVAFFILFGWVLWWPTFRRYRFLHEWWKPDWAKLKELFRLGLPIGITTLFEVTLFQAGVFLMGSIGTAELAAHQIAINVASVTFMVPLGLAQAATVRVGLAAGARDPARVRFAAVTAIGLGAGFMLVCAVLIFLFPREIAGLYLGKGEAHNPVVIAHAVSFLFFAAAFQVFDSSQVTAAGALRGLKDTRVPAMLAGISYWAIGLPVCFWLGLFTSLGGTGVWIGYCVSLAAAALLLCGRVVQLTRPAKLKLWLPGVAKAA